jgi:hypothetical protein
MPVLSQGDRIIIATPYFEQMHQPRVWLLNSTANDLQGELVIDTGRTVSHNAKEGIGQKGALPAKKLEPKGAKAAEKNPNVRERSILISIGGYMYDLLF